MTSTPCNDGPPPRARPSVCAPVSARQVEVLKAARDNRGSLCEFPARLTSAVASLVTADLLEIDVVGFRLTAAGVLLLAEVEERDPVRPAATP